MTRSFFVTTGGTGLYLSMSHPDQERLLASLPAAVRIATESPGEGQLWEEAFESVQFPAGEVYPRPDQLTAEQRAVAEVFADVDMDNLCFALPSTVSARRRWLGLDPGGVLEQEVAFTHAGTDHREPLWRALQLVLDRQSNIKGHIVKDAALILGRLPMLRRLEAIGELFADGKGYDLDAESLARHPNARVFEELRDEGGAWAARLADVLVGRAEDAVRGKPNITTAWKCATFGALGWIVFLALARARVPIAPRWEPLLPVSPAPEREKEEWWRECLLAIDASRRGAALAEVMRAMYPAEALKVALHFLPEVPSSEVLDVALSRLDQARTPARVALRRLETTVADHPALVARVRAMIDELPRIPRLSCERVFTVTSPEPLDALQTEQLQKTCLNWDGNDWPLAERFELNDEGSLKGELEICELRDLDGGPGYIAFLVGLDSGSVFVAGTLSEVAGVIQERIDCKDPLLREALQLALSERPEPVTLPT